MAEPLKVTMGDTWTWTRDSSGDYPASAGWSLSYFIAKVGGTPRKVDAIVVGSGFTVTLLPADTVDTQKWTPGIYSWTARVTKAGEYHSIGAGRFMVLGDPSTTAPTSTHAERCLAIIEAALEKCLTQGDVVEYELDGAKFKKNKTELIGLRNAYRQEIRMERGQLGLRLIPVSLR